MIEGFGARGFKVCECGRVCVVMLRRCYVSPSKQDPSFSPHPPSKVDQNGDYQRSRVLLAYSKVAIIPILDPKP